MHNARRYPLLMASVREAYASTVDRHYSITGILIAAAVALVLGIVIGMLISGGSGLPGTSAFSAITGGSVTSVELRQGGR